MSGLIKLRPPTANIHSMRDKLCNRYSQCRILDFSYVSSCVNKASGCGCEINWQQAVVHVICIMCMALFNLKLL